MSKYAAVIKIGYGNYIIQGDDAVELFNNIYKFQDLDCLIRMGNEHGDEVDIVQLYTLEYMNLKVEEETLVIEDIKKLNLELSIGSLVCVELIEGENSFNELVEKYPNAIK